MITHCTLQLYTASELPGGECPPPSSGSNGARRTNETDRPDRIRVRVSHRAWWESREGSSIGSLHEIHRSVGTRGGTRPRIRTEGSLKKVNILL